MSYVSTGNFEWNIVVEELDEWRARGMTAIFWARDDDAIAMTKPLERLISLAKMFQIELGLAVIPSKLRDSLSEYLVSGEAPFYPMCHGWRHVNYGSPTRPGEFGRERPLLMLVDDANSALQKFTQAFGAFKAIFVPPFARISDNLVSELPKLGFFGVSTGPTAIERRTSRLCSRFSSLRPFWRVSGRPYHYDVHIDPFHWAKSTARPRLSIASEVVGYLRARRRGIVPVEQPIGLLLHHLNFDEASWALCRELVEVLVKHPAAAWPSVRTIVENGDKMLQVAARPNAALV